MKRILVLTCLTFSAINFAQTTQLSSDNSTDSTKNRPGQVSFFTLLVPMGLNRQIILQIFRSMCCMGTMVASAELRLAD